MNSRISRLTVLVGSTVFLFACGGGGGETAPSSGEVIAGTVVKGPVHGASVAAFAITGGSKGAQVGTATTDPMGGFRMSLGSYTGPLMIEASGGTYVDEATGTTMTMQPGDDMVTLLSSVTGGASGPGVQVTPLTTMASARAQNMAGGMTAGNMAAANAAVGQYFEVSDIVHVTPMDPTVAGSAGAAGVDARNYGMAMAAMSQYAHTIGMTSSSAMVTAMANDASDGLMDGMMASSTISMTGMGAGGGMMGGNLMSTTAGTKGLATAMSTFAGSPMNASGVTASDMQALIDKLAASNGTIQ
jgi:hypothetical protein